MAVANRFEENEHLATGLLGFLSANGVLTDMGRIYEVVSVVGTTIAESFDIPRSKIHLETNLTRDLEATNIEWLDISHRLSIGLKIGDLQQIKPGVRLNNNDSILYDASTNPTDYFGLSIRAMAPSDLDRLGRERSGRAFLEGTNVLSLMVYAYSRMS
ncbi:MAG: hypothetical protein AABY10_00300 [Nanoarchaeota archaeon]